MITWHAIPRRSLVLLLALLLLLLLFIRFVAAEAEGRTGLGGGQRI
jgi:hypothetical protein